MYRIEKFNPHTLARRAEIEALAASGETMWKVQNWEYLPNASLDMAYPGGRFRAHSNRFGFRGPEIEVPRPDDVYRISCIGGSTTAEGRSDEETYPAALQRDLRALLDRQQVEVVNCGVSGLNALGQRAKMLGQTLDGQPSDSPNYWDVEPQLFVEYGGVNDICWLLPRFWEEQALQKAPWRAAMARWSTWMRDCLGHAWRPTDDDLAAGLRVRIELLREMAAAARARGVETVFCTFARPDDAKLSQADREFLEHDLRTTWGSVYLSYGDYCRAVDVHNRLLKEFCQAGGYQLIPVAENLGGGLELFIDICHLNSVGIERKAAIIAEHLRERVDAAFQGE